MAMSEDIRENEELESNTSVELDDDQDDQVIEVSSDDDETTRTNVREKSSGDDELENYSDSVQRRINQLTANYSYNFATAKFENFIHTLPRIEKEPLSLHV